jgi:hypothetical protein
VDTLPENHNGLQQACHGRTVTHWECFVQDLWHRHGVVSLVTSTATAVFKTTSQNQGPKTEIEGCRVYLHIMTLLGR